MIFSIKWSGNQTLIDTASKQTALEGAKYLFGNLNGYAAKEATADEIVWVKVKTCRSMDMFMGQVVEYGYLHQAAMYTAIARTLWGINPAFYFIVLEKQVPNRVGLWRIDDDVIQMYYSNPDNVADLICFNERMNLFSGCVDTDIWPDIPFQDKPSYDRERMIFHVGRSINRSTVGDVESSGRK